MKKRKAIGYQILSVTLFLFLAGCGTEERLTQSRGFHLPEGDIVVGKDLFVQFGCVNCHTVAGVDLTTSDAAGGPPKIPLGGDVTFVRSYGELVTSIINPQHVISPRYESTLSPEEKKGEIPSPMPVYNEEMTIGQLVDIAAFLHSRYQLIEPDLEGYYYTTP